MQTVQMSASGVDPRTGRTLTGITAGMIKGQELQYVQDRLGRSRSPQGEPLMPIYAADGTVVAYERSMAPERLSALHRDTHIGRMLGAWAGRQAEEELAQGFNEELVKRVEKIWDDGKRRGRKNEFVNLADPELTDPIYRDAWKMIPIETKQQIERVFSQKDFFPVRKDMVNNTVGYRDASLKDMWTGQSRIDDRARKAFVDTATAIMGRDAFKYLATAEKAWQAGISVAKNTIVIRSIVVPLSNMASNFLQLMTIGVPVRDIYRGMTTKLVEIDQHLRNLERRVELKALSVECHDIEAKPLQDLEMLQRPRSNASEFVKELSPSI